MKKKLFSSGNHLSQEKPHANAAQHLQSGEEAASSEKIPWKRILIVAVLGVVLVLLLVFYLFFYRYYSMLDIQTLNDIAEETIIPFSDDVEFITPDSQDASLSSETQPKAAAITMVPLTRTETVAQAPAASDLEAAGGGEKPAVSDEPEKTEDTAPEPAEAVIAIDETIESAALAGTSAELPAEAVIAIDETIESAALAGSAAEPPAEASPEPKAMSAASGAVVPEFAKTKSTSAIDDKKERDYKNVMNILFVGVDNEDPSSMELRGNADGLMIVSINRKTKQILLTSLLRDINIAVGDKYRTKLTLAYHYGGMRDLVDAIEQNFSVPIDNYVLINYIDLVNIIDAFGGVTLDVSLEEIDLMSEKIIGLDYLMGNEYRTSYISPSQAGVMTLNGVQAAAYVRIRYTEMGDFGRTERLRKVAMQLKDQLLEMSPGEMDRVISAILPNIKTDLSQKEVLNLLSSAFSLMKYEFITQRVPLDGTYEIEHLDGSDVVIDFDINNDFLYQTIYKGHAPEPKQSD